RRPRDDDYPRPARRGGSGIVLVVCIVLAVFACAGLGAAGLGALVYLGRSSWAGQAAGARVSQRPSPEEPPGDNPALEKPPQGRPEEPAAGPEMDALRDGKFARPPRSAAPTSYLKAVSSKGDFVGQGQTYSYTGEQLVVRPTERRVSIWVDGWHIDFGGPGRQRLQAGEYRNARRYAFSDNSPGIDFSGNGRGCNEIAGEFVVWEIEIRGNVVVKLAIDFVQRCEKIN